MPFPFEFEKLLLTNSKNAVERNSAATGNDPSVDIALIIVSHAKFMTIEFHEILKKEPLKLPGEALVGLDTLQMRHKC